MTKQERIEYNKKQRFEKMAVRLANHLGLSSVSDFLDLPNQVKDMLNSFKYIDLVMPLIKEDRHCLNPLSLRQLEVKYGIPKSTINDYLKDR